MKTIILTTILFITSLSFAQKAKVEAENPIEKGGTITEQFDYIITKSTRFKEFQLIRKTSILKVKQHTLDSLKNVEKQLATTKSEIPPLQQEITSLQADLQAVNKKIETVNLEKESINFLGALINKSLYQTIMWVIIAVLLSGLAFFVYSFKNSNSVTAKTKESLIKLEEDFEAFKKRSLEKEQKIMRKLQDEINKNI